MQQIIDSVKSSLEDHFDKKARLTDQGIRINLESLNSNDLRILDRVSRNSKMEITIKRSGTGLVVLFKC